MQNKIQPIPIEISNHPEALYQSGLKAFNLKIFGQAADYFNRAIQADSQQPHYWFTLGLVLQAQGKYDEAAGCFCKALELNPNFAQAYNQLGTLYQIKGNFDEAAANFNLALKCLPDFSQAWNNLGSVLNLQGKIDEATAAFLEAVRLKPGYVLAYNNLGRAYQSQARVEEGPRAVTVNPLSFSPIIFMLILDWGISLLCSGRWKRPRKYYAEHSFLIRAIFKC